MTQITVVMAQINPLVGDIEGNARLILAQSRRAVELHRADVVVFPELALTGYPPEDLLLRASIGLRVERALEGLRRELPDVWVLLGYPSRGAGGLENVAGLFKGGKLVAAYGKMELPNYEVFDEKRYFVAGVQPRVVEIGGFRFALSVCEDIWHERPTAMAVEAGAEILLNINASPYHLGKHRERLRIVERRALAGDVAILYVNQVGGQDELVFDGGSMAIGRDGGLAVLAPHFAEGLFPVRIGRDAAGRVLLEQGLQEPEPGDRALVYQALVTGVRDYVNKNRFKGVVLGLSGGIDSALTLALAVDALGAERVEAVMMPFRYTAGMSIEDAAAQAAGLGVRYRSISIEPMYEAFVSALSEEFAGCAVDVTEQNIQARCRGVLLMAISNKKGCLVLTTGNKSEMAVGYSTLYGDMAGGFDVLKDVPKTLVFALARYRNSITAVIPQRVIDRPPSAELAPDQKDEDSLPPYDILDQILERYVERDFSANAIIADGFDADTVRRVVRLVDLNEYKRRQAPIGVRVTRKAFGRDRRYPVTSGWEAGD
ncbi:MAG: NAD+ synthase [Gammaproteobacteria bacterium]|nr:NAD+ synthase [Gammaproteobacteria bacterium]MBP6053045.1 NAD+ synthase [Pseudomonadales bacterium]MBK6583558.1 NAD+ synthase [Gammaproteobacteria bacterium]MBK7521896.1 NAD+ synthase [Gammaproteobacteria bacterium]MBK7727630.1 NAD+ synthase [Gammaproteobacteria bacterium]